MNIHWTLESLRRKRDELEGGLEGYVEFTHLRGLGI